MVWLFQAWLPGYLEIQRHMSIRTTGFVAAIPYACGVVGSIGAGWVTDRLMAGGFSHELIPDPNLGKGRRKG